MNAVLPFPIMARTSGLFPRALVLAALLVCSSGAAWSAGNESDTDLADRTERITRNARDLVGSLVGLGPDDDQSVTDRTRTLVSDVFDTEYLISSSVGIGLGIAASSWIPGGRVVGSAVASFVGVGVGGLVSDVLYRWMSRARAGESVNVPELLADTHFRRIAITSAGTSLGLTLGQLTPFPLIGSLVGGVVGSAVGRSLAVRAPAETAAVVPEPVAVPRIGAGPHPTPTDGTRIVLETKGSGRSMDPKAYQALVDALESGDSRTVRDRYADLTP